MAGKKTGPGAALNAMKTLPLAGWLSHDRPDSLPVAWQDGVTLTLGDMRRDVSRCRHRLYQQSAERYALCFDNSYRFAVALLAVLYNGKLPVIPGHCRENLLREQACFFDAVISDMALDPGCPVIGPSADDSRHQLPLQALADDTSLMMFTSGSTGQPKPVIKTLKAMDTEAGWIADIIGMQYLRHPGYRIVSSVSHQHLYGLTFRLYLPLSLGIPFVTDQIHFPEELSRQGSDAVNLIISSPAFLRRLDYTLPAPGCAAVFSAGGPLCPDVARRAGQWLGQEVTEIYGSSETGVIGWRRRRRQEQYWHLFHGVRLKTDAPASPQMADTARFIATSPLINDPMGYLLDDHIKLNADGNRFELSGRRDLTVKIEEKRISLNAIEKRLCMQPEITAAAVLPLERNGRQRLAAVIVLTTEGTAALATLTRPERIRQWRKALTGWIDPVAIPRYWRTVSQLPLTSQGKIDRQALMELFG